MSAFSNSDNFITMINFRFILGPPGDKNQYVLTTLFGRWSEKLRDKFEIEELLAGSVISGDVGVRKPDSEINKILVERSGYKIEELLFVDDRGKNVMAARDLGIETILFDPEVGFGEVKGQMS
jgi:putative hydrolase of the HAD superfamily